MATDSRLETSAAAGGQAERVNHALGAMEARLDALEPGADPDVVVRGLRDAVRAFDAALKEAAAS
jgi:hypothetical protein